MLEFLHTNKNKNGKLILEGHIFYMDKKIDSVVYWKCHLCGLYRCKARAVTDNDVLVKRIKDHNHVFDLVTLEVARSISRSKELALASRETPQNIVSRSLIEAPRIIYSNLPTPHNLKRSVRRIRKSNSLNVVLPLAIADIVIPDAYKLTFKNEDFFLASTGESNDKSFIFATLANLRILESSKEWYMDGTFKVVPLLFNQPLTIHVILHNVSIPLVYVLMPNRTIAAYKAVLEKICSYMVDIKCESILTDFEIALISYIRLNYPNIKHRGCFFHFRQALLGKMISIDSEDLSTLFHYKTFAALAYLPTNLIVQGFELIASSLEPNESLNEFSLYFEDNFIGRIGINNLRRSPRFPISMWSIYENIVENMPKTNNNIEGWHRGFSEIVAGNHPNLWSFLESIKTEQNLSEVKIDQLQSGLKFPSQTRAISHNTERISTIVSEFSLEPYDINRYLTLIASLI